MGKVVYIIPGFKESISRKGYQKVMEAFRQNGFDTIPIKVSWQGKVMGDYVEEFMHQVRHNSSDEVYLFGFSFGAIIAMISSIKLQPKTQILCSLSPYFKEDLKYLKKSWKKRVGKKRINDLKQFSFDNFARKINCKTILVAGTNECKKYPLLKRRVIDAHKKIRGSELFLVKNAEHNISQKIYLTKLKEIISSL